MNTPVHSVPAKELLSKAIQQMLVMDVQRLFVCSDTSDSNHISGVLALSDSVQLPEYNMFYSGEISAKFIFI
jgi:hypothetical protein